LRNLWALFFIKYLYINHQLLKGIAYTDFNLLKEDKRKEDKIMLVTIECWARRGLAIAILICYAYQVRYFFASHMKMKVKSNKKLHRFAVLIAARNESAVIEDLIRSVKAQTYPEAFLDVIVVADNCTDNTADLARNAGARVYERFDHNQVGKGYAMGWLFNRLESEHRIYDGYFVFDADNILDAHFVEEMNRIYNAGYSLVTGYRNAKNFGDNWISSGYALWFLHESQLLNRGRMHSGTSCMVSGTGYMISRDALKRGMAFLPPDRRHRTHGRLHH
jgi:cellulose synthase/poly-beta-1,6-N-acetylglucosamine synthase-like glycosyltransferase